MCIEVERGAKVFGAATCAVADDGTRAVECEAAFVLGAAAPAVVVAVETGVADGAGAAAEAGGLACALADACVTGEEFPDDSGWLVAVFNCGSPLPKGVKTCERL